VLGLNNFLLEILNMSKTSNNARLLLGAVVIIFVVATLSLYFFSISPGGIEFGEGLILILPLIILLGFGIFVIKRHKDANGGPLEDERTRNIMNVSMARAYLFSIYWLLFLGFFSEDFGLASLAASSLIGVGILGMAILFGICYIYTSRFDKSIEG